MRSDVETLPGEVYYDRLTNLFVTLRKDIGYGRLSMSSRFYDDSITGIGPLVPRSNGYIALNLIKVNDVTMFAYFDGNGWIADSKVNHIGCCVPSCCCAFNCAPDLEAYKKAELARLNVELDKITESALDEFKRAMKRIRDSWSW